MVQTINLKSGNIAIQNAITGGDGVYMARAMLNIYVEDLYPIFRKANGNVTISQNSFLQYEVYPNPSYGIFNFSFVNLVEATEIIISNAIGQTVDTYSLNGDQTNFILDLSAYEAGIYFYRIKGKTNNIILNGKLINLKF